MLLGAVGGGFTGYGVDQDRRREQFERDRAFQRQLEQDKTANFGQQLQQRGMLQDQGFRPTEQMGNASVRPNGMPGTMGLIPTEAIVAQARRGETLQTPQGRSYTEDRLSTPLALQNRARGDAQTEAQNELNRRVRERQEDAAQRMAEIKAQGANALAVANARQPNVSADGLNPIESRAFRTKSMALKNLRAAIDSYGELLDQYGVEVVPGTEAYSLLSSADANIRLQAKEANALGALTGPDVEILGKLFGDATGPKAAALNALTLGNRSNALAAQLEQYKSIVRGNQAQLNATYGVEDDPDDYQGARPTGGRVTGMNIVNRIRGNP